MSALVVVDANIVLSAVLGVTVRAAMDDALDRDVLLLIPEEQVVEARRVLTGRLGIAVDEAEAALVLALQDLTVIAAGAHADFLDAARLRLHARAAPDAPVLAAALALDGAVWTRDRDFFGVGVPIWSTANMRFAG